ncbi:MAG: hypothetical protein NTY30_01795 [Candidatus Berkelbacteria bacterium]|nr:hypothetical protein [Candidatus Berkelbacteria bacterium]
MKKTLLILVASLVIFLATSALAANGQSKLPTQLTYAKEWINLNLLTWKSESKVKTLDNYATERVANIQTASQSSDDSGVSTMADRYLQLKDKETNIIKTKNISADTINMVVSRELERQKTLSTIRQETKSETVKNQIVKAQEEAVSKTKSAILKKQQDTDVKEFENDIVGAWRDPDGTIDPSNEKNTRVYAAGTTGEGINGVLIDSGEAKITQDSGKLKIEYAPGTGPSSVTSDSGQKKWTIQQSNGTVVENYTSSGWVVVGQSTGVSSNVIVNTVAGGTSSSAQSVTGSSGGTAGVVIKGGNPGVQGSSGSSTTSGAVQNVVQ